MHALRTAAGLLLATFLVPAATAADLTLTLVETPDVVVANDAPTEDGATPPFLFSARVRVDNGASARSPQLSVLVFADARQTDCDEHPSAFPASIFNKQPQLAARESVVVGGETRESGMADEYWPMAVYKKYYNQIVSQEFNNAPGEHAFCAIARVGGSDPACDAPEQQACEIAKATFRAYVRHTNEGPVLTSFEMLPEAPRPGQEVLFRAEATDADTVPKRDTITYAWDFGTEQLSGPVVRHRFGLPGEFTVTLTVTDGFERVTEERVVTVKGLPVDGGDGDENGSPGAGATALVLVAVLVALTRRRRA